MKFNQMTDEEKRRLLMSIYFLYKGLHQLGRVQDTFSERETDVEIKEAMVKMQNLSAAIVIVTAAVIFIELKKRDS
ncbi:hypothetical protein [Neobacillus sp. SuZ13]|uniref:hypothetical protein n=1 Tax=Neobacillus sp. SuZ13 TaxID=3047875 RepID=UPI0024BF345B|nr:hypothetical protein [Neobacillus sp. SuZ13]WHY69615.1 hypothetical protein QNH17_13685 [Neobacillus sp. SuZ13]